MEDKSLNIMLMVMFGISGVTMLFLTWLLPELMVEKVPAIFCGAIGIVVAMVLGLTLRSAGRAIIMKQVSVIKIKDKS